MTLTVKDLERVQAKLDDDYRAELVDGDIVLMSPLGYESDEVASEFSAQLRNWAKPRRFAELAPDLMVEVKSLTDSLKGLRVKMNSFLQQGTQVGILIHPEQRWLEVCRLGEEPLRLSDGKILTLPDLLPGWEVQVSDLWPPVFEE